MVTSTLSVLGHYTIFDFRSTNSFIYVPFVTQAGFELESLLHVFSISTPKGINLIAKDSKRWSCKRS